MTQQSALNDNTNSNHSNPVLDDIDCKTAQHFHISHQAGKSALDLLANETQLSKQLLKQYAQKGAVWIQRNATARKPSKPERLRRLKKEVTVDQSLDFYYNPELLSQVPPPAILVKDFTDYSVWIKPRGMLSQGSKWADHTALYRWIEMNYQPNAQIRQSWIVHRLDRATHGLVLVAHTKKMAAALSRAFEENQVKKTYQAMVWGHLSSEVQTITHNIDGKTAISHVRLLKYDAHNNISRVEVEIETGRKHQIRRHLSEEGYPIIGDRMYGNQGKDEQFNNVFKFRPNLQLTAYKLCLLCPIAQSEICFKLEPDQLDLLNVV